jgi:predicted HicB family RNase H-like nuclease
MTKRILKYKGYFGSVNNDTNDNIFYGKVLYMKTSITYHAKHISDLKNAFKEAIDDYIEFCKQNEFQPETTADNLNVKFLLEENK